MSTYDSLYLNSLASATAGCVGRMICHPIDTIKSKIQASDSFRGIRDVIQKTWRNEGIKGFYKGLGVVLIGSAPGVCIYFTTYEQSKTTLLSYNIANPFAVYLASGMIAEIAW